MKRIFKFILYSGALWFLLSYMVCVGVLSEYVKINQTAIYEYSFLFAGVFWFFVLSKNIMSLWRGNTVGWLTWMEPLKYEPPEESARRYKAQHPVVDAEFLSDEPSGLVLGKQGKKYVRVPICKGNIQNAIIMGAPGCGKSVLLLTTLINQLNVVPEDERMTFFTLDIKPELAKKSVAYRGNSKVKVMNPMDRTTYGWNPYYNLNKDSSDDDIMAELDVIANALINSGKDKKNEFFYESARTVMKAILFWTYKQGYSFVQGLNYLMEDDIAGCIIKVLDAVEGKPEFISVSRLIKSYANKDSEAFQGIELTFKQSLSCFTTQTVQFFLDGNIRKASPNDLEEHISVFFSIPETKIEEYQCLLRLVTMQIMRHCSGRSEDSHMLTLVIDEAARLGSINWTSFLSTSRSRQCATILAFQSLSQMQTCWSKEEAKSLIELCRVIAVLSCTDVDTANMLSNWVGTYKEEKLNLNEGGKNKGTYSRSFEDKKILEPSDIMTLQDSNEVILFIKGKYYRCDVSGARYFNIKELNEISQQCVVANEKEE